ncbi:MAG: hypothetical protein U0237_09355 [Thermoleophilia bacterium]
MTSRTLIAIGVTVVAAGAAGLAVGFATAPDETVANTLSAPAAGSPQAPVTVAGVRAGALPPLPSLRKPPVVRPTPAPSPSPSPSPAPRPTPSPSPSPGPVSPF